MEQFIECPKCKCQYYPSEVFIPEYLLGNPTDIMRDSKGKIVISNSTLFDPNEEFTCEHCGAHFTVKASISFDVKIDEQHSFDNEYTSTIYEDRISLKEE